jgi:hypothetical protein
MSTTRAGKGGWSIVAGASVAAAVAGCVIDTRSQRDGEMRRVGSAGPPAGVAPMLVVVDADRTLIASPGAGVGVFTEYQTGGHWHVWWTCDTSVTGLPCSFQVAVSVSSGALSGLAGQLLEPSDTLVQPTAAQAQVTTTTTTGVDGIAFDAAPGVAITVDAQVDGLKDGSLMFFVQNGVANGNYQGALTDPLVFEPASP